MSGATTRVTYLIIGGGIAGTTAAETIRRRDPHGTIAIVSEEPHRLYSRILLSKPQFFLKKIPPESVWLKSEAWYADQNIRFIGGRKAARADTRAKIITLDDRSTLRYEKLLLAVGGDARRCDAPGADGENIFYLRTLDDATRIIEKTAHARKAVVLGGGFVGFEMCSMLRQTDIETTLLLRDSRIWEPFFDEKGSAIIEDACARNGVHIRHHASVSEIQHKDERMGVVLADGSSIPFDMLIIGIGIICPHTWIKDAGIDTQEGIATNEYLETNTPDVWAAGDAAEYNDILLREHIRLGNWVNAQMQGRVAGMNMIGERTPFRLVSSYTTSGFGLAIAFVGDARCRNGRVSIARSDPERISHARMLLENGRLIGAALINRTEELGVLSKLIESGKDLMPHIETLKDTSRALAELI